MSTKIFVIDTDTYAGSFERELTAYITGQIGECGVGEEEQKMALKELPEVAKLWFEDNVRQVPDDGGCHRPTTIWSTPGWFSIYGNLFPEGTSWEEVDERSVRIAHEQLDERITFYAGKVSGGDKSYKPTLKHYKKELADNLKRITDMDRTKFPAYQSVAIFLYAEPPDDILDLMKERAHKYFTNPGGAKYFTSAEILGFRLLTKKTKYTGKEV